MRTNFYSVAASTDKENWRQASPHRDGLKGLEISLPYPIKEILQFLFLAFIAYLVEMEVFGSLKMNYLFVGLTATAILYQ